MTVYNLSPYQKICLDNFKLAATKSIEFTENNQKKTNGCLALGFISMSLWVLTQKIEFAILGAGCFIIGGYSYLRDESYEEQKARLLTTRAYFVYKESLESLTPIQRHLHRENLIIYVALAFNQIYPKGSTQGRPTRIAVSLEFLEKNFKDHHLLIQFLLTLEPKPV